MYQQKVQLYSLQLQSAKPMHLPYPRLKAIQLIQKAKSTLHAIIRDGFCLKSLRTCYSFFNIKKQSNQKNTAVNNVFNRKNQLILESLQIYLFKLHSNDFSARRPLSFVPKISYFMLKLSRREKQWQSYQRGIGEADVFVLTFTLPSHVCSPIIR